MATFGITPVTGFPPVTDGGFPRFIQFQDNGDDVGNRSVENVNFAGNVATSVSSDGSTVTVDVGAGFAWRDVPGDYTLTLDDEDSGLSASSTSGVQTITVPGDDEVPIRNGASIIIVQYGGGGVQVVAASGVQLLVRDGLSAVLAGEYATATLLKREANVWIICGDLAAA